MQIEVASGNPYMVILAGLVSVIGAYYVNKVLKRWAQKYIDQRQQSKVGSAKEEARSDNTAANAESDVLRDIDRG